MAQSSIPAQSVISMNAKFSGLSMQSPTEPEQERSSDWSAEAQEEHCVRTESAHLGGKPLKLLFQLVEHSRLAKRFTVPPCRCRAQSRSPPASLHLLGL